MTDGCLEYLNVVGLFKMINDHLFQNTLLKPHFVRKLMLYFFYKQNVTYFKLDGHYVNASVLFNDLLAGNGMIHVIDKIMWHVGDYQETRSVSDDN